MNNAGRIDLPARPRILVISLRRLGDVLLTTPLIRSLRAAWPDATIEALVFGQTAGILEGNPDLDGVVAMPAHSNGMRGLLLAARLWRRYDLAISTQTGDRPTIFAVAAGRLRIGLVDQTLNGRFKRVWLHRSVPFDRHAHRVEQVLQLVDAAGIPRVAELVGPRPRAFEGMPRGDYAVIHAGPMFRYKQWTAHGWRATAAALASRGLQVVATGGPDEVERRYLNEIWAGSTVTRVDGGLDWAQLAHLLSKARVFVGPDTSVTHLAAASGCPTVAIYGPTDPRLWAPWPAGGMVTLWDASGLVQRRSNVWLVQNPLPCMPCQLEGCERHLGSHSACLDELTPQRVIAAVDQALAVPVASG